MQVLRFAADRLKNEQPMMTSRLVATTAQELSGRIVVAHIPLLDMMRQNASMLDNSKGSAYPMLPLARCLATSRIGQCPVRQLLSDQLVLWAMREVGRFASADSALFRITAAPLSLPYIVQ